MAYVDVPLAPQRIKDSQPIIRQNFVEINALVDVDHYTFGSLTAGEHKKVTLPDQGVSPVFAGNDLGIFAKIPTVNPLTGINELFIRRQDGSQTPFSAADLNVNGWSYLPSGLLLKWGVSNGTGTTTVVYPVAANIPVFNAPFVTFLTVLTVAGDPDGAVSLVAGASLAVSFDVFCSTRTFNGAGPVGFLYLTLGF